MVLKIDCVILWVDRFMSLTLRPHSVNCFAYSKLTYRCNVIDKWIEDPPTSPPPGMCGTKDWYYDEQEDTPEQLVADLIELEERMNMGEEYE